MILVLILAVGIVAYTLVRNAGSFIARLRITLVSLLLISLIVAGQP